MKKSMAVCTAAALLAAALAGCGAPSGAPSSGEANVPETGAVYSNLSGEASRAAVSAALLDHGMAEERVTTFFSWADDFNGRVTSGDLAADFVPMEGSGVDYSGLTFDLVELPDGDYMPEANCRLTAFLLLGDQISTNGAYDDSDTYLMFDLDAVDTRERFAMSEEERANFAVLFNWVPLEGADSAEGHLEKIQQAWQDREIRINTAEGVSLITVYLHSAFDDARFVGHTGVLLEQEDGLLFMEKYGPTAPFQATRFENRAQLKSYLLARPDLYGGEEELEPIVLENDAVME